MCWANLRQNYQQNSRRVKLLVTPSGRCTLGFSQTTMPFNAQGQIFPCSSHLLANYRILLRLLGSVTAVLCRNFSLTSLRSCYIYRPYITSNLHSVEIFCPYSLKNNISSTTCNFINLMWF